MEVHFLALQSITPVPPRQETGGFLAKPDSRVSSLLTHVHIHFTHGAKCARLLLLHDAILGFQWAWSKVTAIYTFVNKLPCRVSMGKGGCYFKGKMKMLPVPQLAFIVPARSTGRSGGKKPPERGDQKPETYLRLSIFSLASWETSKVCSGKGFQDVYPYI